MRSSIYLLTLAFSGFFTGLVAQSSCDSTIRSLASEKHYHGCLPKCHGSIQPVQHTAYTLGYSEQHEQAAWVCYVLSKSECGGSAKRSASFYEDGAVKTGSATDADYAESGYDRGHLAPAADMAFSPGTMKESFFYSNMSPQAPQFNRGIWKKLETQVREWGQLYGSCLVIAGPVLTDSLKTIGTNGVSIPQLYYKIVLNPNAKPPQAIGFLMQNEASKLPLTSFVVSVDSIETVTGIDFFPTLSAGCQQQLESHVDGKSWKGFEQVAITPSIRSGHQEKKKTQTRK